MAMVDVSKPTVLVSIVRILEVVLTCVSFSLVASVGHTTESFWTWCMFTWCFCFGVTLLILVLGLFGLGSRLDDFATAFAMLSTLMVLSASVIYPTFYTCSMCDRQIAATIASILAFILYATEVGLTRAKPRESRGFLSTVPGCLKILEAFVACIIFICLRDRDLSKVPVLQWCVAVYSICFIFAMIFIIFTTGRLLSLLPASFDIVLKGCNVLAVPMYLTAVVLWPLYGLGNVPRSRICKLPGFCIWDEFVVIAFMTAFNLVVYIYHTVYSFTVR